MDPLGSLTKLVYDATVSGKKALPNKSTSASSSNSGDIVDLSSGNTLDYLKTQAADLKVALPGMIADSLLRPLSDNIISQDPLNALITQFISPAQTLLSSKSAQDLSPEQMKSLQQEVTRLHQFIPTMMANTLLAPFVESGGNSLNGILQSMSSQLNDLANLVQQKIQG